jgi:hypothetical protein
MKSKATVLSLTIVVTLNIIGPRGLRAQTPAQNAQAHALFIEGRNLWDDGNFVDAEKKFRETLTKYPKAEQSDRTTYYLITTLVKLGRTADARAEIENFDKSYPQSSWKSDVEEKRLTLNGLPAVFPLQGIRYFGYRGTAPGIPVSLPSGQPFARGVVTAAANVNASLDQEVLRLIIQKDSDLGIEEARRRLKVNPSDPAVVTNLSTIANSGSAQAVPFLLTLTVNTSITPNTRDQALFWMNRVDKETMAKALPEMLKERGSIPAVAETLTRFNVVERRSALEQIVKGGGPERIAMLDKLYKGTTNVPLRSQIIQFVGQITDPAALAFLDDIARNQRETLSLRSEAIRVLGERKDVDAKTLVEIMNSLPPTPAKPVR